MVIYDNGGEIYALYMYFLNLELNVMWADIYLPLFTLTFYNVTQIENYNW
jgi:hypothetical protein